MRGLCEAQPLTTHKWSLPKTGWKSDFYRSFTSGECSILHEQKVTSWILLGVWAVVSLACWEAWEDLFGQTSYLRFYVDHVEKNATPVMGLSRRALKRVICRRNLVARAQSCSWRLVVPRCEGMVRTIFRGESRWEMAWCEPEVRSILKAKSCSCIQGSCSSCRLQGPCWTWSMVWEVNTTSPPMRTTGAWGLLRVQCSRR